VVWLLASRTYERAELLIRTAFVQVPRPLLLVLLPVLMFGCLHRKPPGTKEEAKAMAIRAAEYLKKVGPKAAFPAFNTGGEWHDRDLYVFVFDHTGMLRASGEFRGQIGLNLLPVPDVTYKFWVKQIISIKDQGWINYRYWSPLDITKNKKSSYCIHTGDYFVCVGAYDYK
jgi:cytochrome c